MVVALALGLATAAVPAGGYHLGLDAVHTEEVDRPGAFGVSVDLAEDAESETIEYVVNGYGEKLSTPVSHGTALFDGDGTYLGMVVVTVLYSPNRVHLETSPTGEIVSEDGGRGVHVETHGDLSSAGELELVLETSDGSSDEAPTMRTFTAWYGRGPGTHQVITWLGEAEGTELVVRTEANVTDLRTEAGTAHVAGDQDMERSTVNAQAQEGFVAGSVPLEDTESLGAKAMARASVEADVDRELHGAWSLFEDKGTCLAQPLCLEPTDVYDACRLAIGVDCGPASISWTNGTQEGTAQGTYIYNGADPGAYTFTVDRKADAYEVGGPGFDWQENHSFLSVGDAGLPAE
ncbi:hypothetical protein BRD56_12215 [Thermoplasmatales archaeon SW_10_69_26]|nr:MAG: hypothetical protein BRD56_12215 [Thermoplasmatales archaeon SW_10_69_26]